MASAIEVESNLRTANHGTCMAGFDCEWKHETFGAMTYFNHQWRIRFAHRHP